MRPQLSDPYQAARVSAFMREAEHGRWCISKFTITRGDYQREAQAIRILKPEEEARMELARQVPPGEYLSLRRRAAAGEKSIDGFVPVMSDTPAEIAEHSWIIDNAHGDVLVTGLGLGVCLSALLAKPEVTSVTVVEIDYDVIDLTWPYYEDDPRASIVRGDGLAMAAAFKNTKRKFDFAWHDIWSSISSRNLSDAEAEHGISYQAMFDAWAPICDQQGAWAMPEAQHQKRVLDAEQEVEEQWEAKLLSLPFDEQVEMLVRRHVADLLCMHDPFGEPPEEAVEQLDQMFNLRQLFREKFATFDYATFSKHREGPDPLGRPNEEEEANVA